MKILVISLLRLGDIFMASPAIQGLRKKYPDSKIDLLVNSQFTEMKSLLSEVDKVIGFDRQGLQSGLGEAACPLMDSFDYLAEIINELNATQYDLVINLTQNKLSGYLTALIDTKERIGLSINANEQASYSSPWFRYLNDYVASGASTTFHYTDIFKFSLSADSKNMQFYFSENKKGDDEAKSFFAEINKTNCRKIVIQALTSDSKKNLGHAKWVETIVALGQLESSAVFILLGAPNERTELEQIQIELKRRSLHAHIAILSLDGALSLLNSCDLLITGDTSIKHLAAGSKISILEMSIGSSDYRKTGTYKPGSLIIKSNEGCSPCRHSASCHRDQHYCSINIPGELIAVAASKLLHNDWAGIKILAAEYSDTAELIRTKHKSSEFWMGEKLSPQMAHVHLNEMLDVTAWKFLLTKAHLSALAPYGSESLKIKENLFAEIMKDQLFGFKHSLEQLEKSTAQSEIKLNKILSSLSRCTHLSNGNGVESYIEDGLQCQIVSVENDLAFGNIFTSKMKMSDKSGLYQIRQLQNALNEAFGHQQIKLKLISALRSQVTESI